MKKWIWFTGFVFSIAAFALPKTDGPLGFFELSDARVTTDVATAANSVVEVDVASGPLVTVQSIFGAEPIQHAIERMTSITKFPPGFTLGDRDVYVEQLRKCVQTPDPSQCKMHELVTHGSGAIIRDGSTIRTAFHVIVKTGNGQTGASNLEFAKVDVNRLELLIYRRDHHLIYNGFIQTAKVDVPANVLEARHGYRTLPNDDYVNIQLDQMIGRPLAFAKTTPKPGDKIYLLGYPGITKDRQAFGAPDSPGGRLMVTFGQVISQQTSLEQKEQGNWKGLSADERARRKSASVNIDADAHSGTSGGPALNDRGEIVGTFTWGNPDSAALWHYGLITNEANIPK